MCNNVDPFVVDARSYGNVARFISHSCEPNLSLQQVVVEEDEEKYFHLAFFSVREISPQEELTINYNLKSPGGHQACNCGAQSCRGYMTSH
mmetsp:Transcript_30276/g.78320  ORF Transcript_30276/g.78320 Transcript_30276/m.78320 type:complete len:91 (-) Transcript_30276:2492-2764(-)